LKYATASQAFCPVREIPKSKAHENVLEAFSIKDKVRGIPICYVLLFTVCYIRCILHSRETCCFGLLYQISLYICKLYIFN